MRRPPYCASGRCSMRSPSERPTLRKPSTPPSYSPGHSPSVARERCRVGLRRLIVVELVSSGKQSCSTRARSAPTTARRARLSDSAAAPRTAAPSPKAEGRTTNVQAGEGRASSVRRTSPASHGASGPKQPPSTTAWTSKRLTAEREADPSGPLSSSARTTSSPASARRTSSPSGCASGRPSETPAARDRLLADERLDAPAAPHAQGPVRVDRDVAELAAEAVRAAKQAPPSTMPPPTPTSPKTQTKSSTHGGARPVLCERREVRLVLDVDGTPAEPLRDSAATASSSSRDSAPEHACPAPRRAPAPRPRARGQARSDGLDRLAASSPAGRARAPAPSLGCRGRAALVADRAGQVLDGHRDVVDVHLEPDADDGRRARASAPGARRRAARRPRPSRAADRARSARRRDSRRCRASGPSPPRPAPATAAPGATWLQHDAEVRPAHGRLIGGRARPPRALRKLMRALVRAKWGCLASTRSPRIAQTRRRVLYGHRTN